MKHSYTGFLAQVGAGEAKPAQEAKEAPAAEGQTKQPGGPEPEQAPKQQQPGWWSFVPLILMFGVLYLFLFRGRGKEQKQRKEMLAQLAKGDRVMTIGGMIGTVMDADKEYVLLKLDESTNTKARFTRGAIQKVIKDEK